MYTFWEFQVRNCAHACMQA